MSHPSAYLPEDFRSDRPIGIIAGQRNYPVLLAERLRKAGQPSRLIAFEGETESSLVEGYDEKERAIIKVGQVGKLLKALRKLDCGYAIMAGQITPGRLFRDLHPDFKALTMLATLRERNAETVFGALATEIEKLDVQLLDARAFMDEDLCSSGPMGKGRFRIDTEHLEHGIRIARHVASEDIGQGVVVSRGTVLAVEAFEGTDAMLQRAGQFEAPDKLFVKTVKPVQDYRFDVPVFGERTLDVLEQAGIRHVALAAGQVLMLDREQVLAQARARNVALYGYVSNSE